MDFSSFDTQVRVESSQTGDQTSVVCTGGGFLSAPAGKSWVYNLV